MPERQLSMDPLTTVDAIAQIMQPPYKLIEGVLRYDFTFAQGNYPGEERSELEPPFRVGKKQEIFPIDELLGRYEPEKQLITIYNKGIKEVAAQLDVREFDVLYIVRLHEWAHAILHLGMNSKERQELSVNKGREFPTKEALEAFQSIEDSVHELLAQILVFYALQDAIASASVPEARSALERILTVFHKIESHQPPEYNIGSFLNVPRARVLKAIDLLKMQILPGKSDLWTEILVW